MEFIRNDVLDAQTFPATTRLPYRQNQYGLYLGARFYCRTSTAATIPGFPVTGKGSGIH